MGAPCQAEKVTQEYKHRLHQVVLDYGVLYFVQQNHHTDKILITQLHYDHITTTLQIDGFELKLHRCSHSML